MSRHLTPFAVCERLLGKPEVIGPLLGIDRKTPFGWRHGSSNRDAGDLPSFKVARRLLAHAAARNIPLTPNHLIWGASEAEIDALLAHPAAPRVEAAE